MPLSNAITSLESVVDTFNLPEVKLVFRSSSREKQFAVMHIINQSDTNAHAKHKVYDDKTVSANSGIENFMTGDP